MENLRKKTNKQTWCFVYIHHRDPAYNLDFQAQVIFFSLKQEKGGYKQAIICQCDFFTFGQFELSGLSGKYFFLSPFGNRQIYWLKSLWTFVFMTRAEEKYLLKIIFCKSTHGDYGQPNLSCLIHNVKRRKYKWKCESTRRKKKNIDTNTNINCMGFFPAKTLLSWKSNQIHFDSCKMITSSKFYFFEPFIYIVAVSNIINI